METTIELFNEIKALGKGIYKITVEYYSSKSNSIVNEIVNIPKVSSGKMALAILTATLKNSGADTDMIEIKDYLYSETAAIKYTLETVTKKTTVPKAAAINANELAEIEA